jgi:hypothetical protein
VGQSQSESEQINKRNPDDAGVYYDKGQAHDVLAQSEKRGMLYEFGIRVHPPRHLLQALDAYDAASRLAPDNLKYRQCWANNEH